ncbi:MAG: hypothetical protein ACFFCS_25330 [Candidatus Hodarchaeota archaeon]
MRKYFVMIAAVIALPILIPIEWCAFWTYTEYVGFETTGFISAYGIYFAPNGATTYLGYLYTIAGMLPIAGSALLFVDLAVDKRVISAIGGLLLIAGPITWIFAHINGESLIQVLTSIPPGSHIFIGEFGGTTSWTITWGFFFPIVGGMTGLFGAGGRK